MTATNVFWLGVDPTRLGDFWDCTIVADLLDGNIWTPPGFPTFQHHAGWDNYDGGVLVIAGREYVNRVAEINALCRDKAPVATIIVKDEGSDFPVRELTNSGPLWVQNARPDRHDGLAVRPFPVGWSPGVRAAIRQGIVDKPIAWFFAGQTTTARRKQCVAQMAAVPGGECLETAGFLQGMPYPEYLQKMRAARLVPCPGGVITPDSFRVWETLETGGIPLPDAHGGCGEVVAYWPNLFRRELPFPVISDWMEGPGAAAKLLDSWPYHSNRIESWWANWKRDFVYRFHDDIRSRVEPVSRPGDRITVLMPTSSIPSHPDTSIIEQTLRSIRDRPELAGCEIIITCDGLHDRHRHRRAGYDEYIRRLHQLCKRWDNVFVLVFNQPMHQSGMAVEAMKYVRTPAVLYVEHDTPMIGEIPFENLVDAVLSDADIVRLHHEVRVLAVHAHLMPDHRSNDDAWALCEVRQVAGVPMVRTFQWSQRPHVANAGFYRQLLTDHFDAANPTFIEDRMCGIVESAWRRHGEAGWMRYRMWMYHPDGGNIQRSIHSDGRAGEDKAW